MLEILRNIIFVLYSLRYYLIIFWFSYLLRQVIFIVKFFKSEYKEESRIKLFKYLFNAKYFSEANLFMRLEKLKIPSKILTNLQIPTSEGLAEIDILYININGIYVITSKNHMGWMYGFTKSIEWTRKLLGMKHNFYNIIMDNEKKIEFLEEKYPNLEVKQLIIFNKKCDLKNLKVNRRMVIKEKDLERRILKHRFQRNMEDEKVEEIYLDLKQYVRKDEDIEAEDEISPLDRMIDIIKTKLNTKEKVLEE